MDILVDCILRREHPHGEHYGIEHLGGPDNGRGMRWIDHRKNIIASIKHGRTRFYTRHGSGKQYIEIVNGPHGEYLRTFADETPTDNLLHQSSCPQY
jgi:hypothetical protein